MIVFPNAKINFGLNIVEKREDGFHNIETIFYPLNLCDVLEIVEVSNLSRGEYEFVSSGIKVDCLPEENIVIKAYQLISEKYNIPGVKIYLHKNIPFGAGLGGGSADAAFTLKVLNENFNLKLSVEELEEYASQLGSDCPFFVNNTPVFAHGRGELFEKTDLDIDDMFIVLIKPQVSIPTPAAYAGIVPGNPKFDLRNISRLECRDWKESIENDFEKIVFNMYPEIRDIKNKLYEKGAIYAAMSGSGASVFGVFKKEIDLKDSFPDCFYWAGY